MPSLDPTEWSELRLLGYRMLDDMFDHLAGLRDGPLWQPTPEVLRWQLRRGPPRQPHAASGRV